MKHPIQGTETTHPAKNSTGRPCFFLNHSLLSLLLVTLVPVLTLPDTAAADSATWNLSPTNGDWNTAANWTPATVPNGPSDTATFDFSNLVDVSLSSSVEVDSIVISSTATPFTISTSPNNDLTISGAGIINDSGDQQQFLVPVDSTGDHGMMEFFNAATAGTGTVFTVQGSTASPAASGGVMIFWESTTAGDAAITLEGGGTGALTKGGRAVFMGHSTAANATFVCQGGGDGNFGGSSASAEFYNHARAGNATLIAEGNMDPTSSGFGGAVVFVDQSRAENATLIATEGAQPFLNGYIFFGGSAKGGNAKVQLFGGALLMNAIAGPSLTIGSLEGDGNVLLGSKSLVVGQNGTGTSFDGLIYDTGSVTKIGAGTWTLSSANTYTGGTTVDAGRLIVNNTSGSATGSGPVQVNAGTLGGSGNIAGAVTVGTGSGAGAVLAPGRRGGKPGNPLTIQSTLMFDSDATYDFGLYINKGIADQVIANGVTINSAQFSFAGLGTGRIPDGTVFTVINNTAATPIAGTFSNLADGAIVNVNGNNLQANYEGGDGNDLTLTVVP